MSNFPTVLLSRTFWRKGTTLLIALYTVLSIVGTLFNCTAADTVAAAGIELAGIAIVAAVEAGFTAVAVATPAIAEVFTVAENRVALAFGPALLAAIFFFDTSTGLLMISFIWLF